jgi:hypothetical protein
MAGLLRLVSESSNRSEDQRTPTAVVGWCRDDLEDWTPGAAPPNGHPVGWGPKGRWFKSSRPDSQNAHDVHGERPMLAQCPRGTTK